MPLTLKHSGSSTTTRSAIAVDTLRSCCIEVGCVFAESVGVNKIESVKARKTRSEAGTGTNASRGSIKDF